MLLKIMQSKVLEFSGTNVRICYIQYYAHINSYSATSAAGIFSIRILSGFIFNLVHPHSCAFIFLRFVNLIIVYSCIWGHIFHVVMRVRLMLG